MERSFSDLDIDSVGGFDEYSQDVDKFEPMSLEDMPSNALKDVLRHLRLRQAATVNIDAILPADSTLCFKILRTVLYLIDNHPDNSVKTLSIRFNKLDAAAKELLVSWLDKNNKLEFLYVMGSGFEPPFKQKLDAAWKKNLMWHRCENNGFTFQRVTRPPPVSEDD